MIRESGRLWSKASSENPHVKRNQVQSSVTHETFFATFNPQNRSLNTLYELRHNFPKMAMETLAITINTHTLAYRPFISCHLNMRPTTQTKANLAVVQREPGKFGTQLEAATEECRDLESQLAPVKATSKEQGIIITSFARQL